MKKIDESTKTEPPRIKATGSLPVRKGPAGIKVYLNTWNLKKNNGGFFPPPMRWNTGGKLYVVTK